MCGIAGLVALDGNAIPNLRERLEGMNARQRHRGPDGQGVWTDPSGVAGLAHVRLAIIDPELGVQPMTRNGIHLVTYNGEIYNYIELRRELGESGFATKSDTEVLLAAYERWGPACVDRLRGMFAFAIWDTRQRRLFCARDRFGMKPLHHAVARGCFAFASEAKTLLPLLPRVETDREGLKDYLAFQFVMGEKTLFEGVRQLPPAHVLEVHDGKVTTRRYWEVSYDPDLASSPDHFRGRTLELLGESVALHLRSDVPVGSYLSGGLDSSLVTTLARRSQSAGEFHSYVGRFLDPGKFDETPYAAIAAEHAGATLHVVDIGADDFVRNIRSVVRHLDYPVAGPGSFAQFMVSRAASRDMKVLLGGQGGDEIFGGYVRYLVAYFEACIKAAIDGTSKAASFVVTYESIIPNLAALRGYEPLLRYFWRDGLFEDRDRRYFRLISRAEGLRNVIDWSVLEPYSAYQTFRSIFWSENVRRDAYFDSMTHFDFKTLLPALLQVEDRMSMAHGLESRVPLLDHELVQFVATAPAIVKFRDGRLKHLLREVAAGVLPDAVVNRPDKMGFPVPFTQWTRGPIREFVADTLGSAKAQSRSYLQRGIPVDAVLDGESEFGRNLWALLNLELWQQEFHDSVRPEPA